MTKQFVSLRSAASCEGHIYRLIFHGRYGSSLFEYSPGDFSSRVLIYSLGSLLCSFAVDNFFKALKQSLKIKTFIGTSPNAVKTQIWTALIAMLLLKYLQLKSIIGWSLSNLVALLRMNLFTYRDLWAWIDNPYNTPPQPLLEAEQITLAL
jgi:hypothetical protein